LLRRNLGDRYVDALFDAYGYDTLIWPHWGISDALNWPHPRPNRP